MNCAGDPMPPRSPGWSSATVDNLRAAIIVLVIAFHSALAYLQFLPHHPFPFDSGTMLWRAFPIVDHRRWIGFDIFCAWLDVYLMSFFFLLSGLFVWPSLARKGGGRFCVVRLMRLGLPFIAVVALVMPVALYPTYLQGAVHPSIADYWRHWRALPVWPSGPMWFLWLLLVGDLLAGGVFALLGQRGDALLRLSELARRRPVYFLVGLLLASALAYVPLAFFWGTQDWFQRGPFAFQLCRPLLYVVYFSAGVIIGARGIERGLTAPDGPLAQRWKCWLIAAPVALLIWMCLTGLTLREGAAAPIELRVVDDLSYAAACFTNCFMMLAVGTRFAGYRTRLAQSLKSNAFGMYLVHYLFVVWLQYAAFGLDLPAIAKGAIVFFGALSASWGLAIALRRLPLVTQIVGETRRNPARVLRPTPNESAAASLIRH